jgi:uncharacterized membrane protein HdeD (DUF308 family)
MEQNLSEEERWERLVLGIVAITGGTILLVYPYPDTAAYILYALGAGLLANYITCFCGAKKLVDSIVDKYRE